MNQRLAERLPHKWHEALDDIWWAEQFGWPPQVVDEIPAGRAQAMQYAKNELEQGRDAARKEESKDG